MQRFKLFVLAVLLPMAGVHTATIAQEVAEVSSQGPKFPTEVIKRPFTLPSGSFEARLQMNKDVMDTDNFVFRLGVGVGITNDLELGVMWDGVNVNQRQVNKSVGLNAGYFLYAVPGVAAMLSLNVPLYFGGEQRNAAGALADNGYVFRSVSLSMPTAFSINSNMNFMAFHDDFLAIYRGSPALADTTVDPDLHAKIRLPFKFGWQATSRLWLNLGTNFATFYLGGTDKFVKNSKYIWQETPITASALYAITNAVDVSLSTGFGNLQDPGKTFNVFVGLNVRAGRLDG